MSERAVRGRSEMLLPVPRTDARGGAPDRAPPAVESVRRALRVLRCFRLEEPELGVTDIARELGLPKSTVHRLLATLEAEGFVHQLNGSRYVLGWKAFELGAAVWAWNAMRQPVLRRLESLVTTTGETGHLGVLDEGEVLYIEKVESPRPLRMPSAVGRRVPVHCTALGKTLLAGLEGELAGRLIRDRPLRSFTTNTITEPNTLLREIEQARSQGFAIDREEIEEGLMCVAAPVVDEQGDTCAAISISGPASRITPRLEDQIVAVRETCVALSRDLGPNARRLREISTLVPPEPSSE